MTPNYHEREEVVLTSSEPIDRHRLDRWLRRRGFKAEDDFYYLSRGSRSPPWQSTTLLSVTLYRSGVSIYETEEDLADGISTDWNQLRVGYLMATLPRECIDLAISQIAGVAEEFRLVIAIDGEVIDALQLSKRWNEIADHLAQEWDEPGSEWLAILIEQQY